MSTSTAAPTKSSERALRHLKRLKPLDGWSVERKSDFDVKLFRLTRRNVPLTDNYFLDVHYDDASNTVVGILTQPKPVTNKCQAQVLVDRDGTVVGRKVDLIAVDGWDGVADTTTTTSNRTTADTSRSSAGSGAATTSLLTEQNSELIRLAGYVLGGMVLLKVVLQAAAIAYVLAVPLLYLYLLYTCPPERSFDAKQQLKRVLRGQHLPDTDPNKPKGWLNETLARVQATVATELSTSLGYEVLMVPLLGGAMVWTQVKVPAANMNCYWIGAANRWTYLYSSEITKTTKVE